MKPAANLFTVSITAADLARYASMHAAAPELNCWRDMMIANLQTLAGELGYTLVQKQKEAA